MLEITKIKKRSNQGMTQPFLCEGSNGKTYYVKGKAANASGLIKEWLGAQLANAFVLPLAPCQILYVDSSTLVKYYSEEAIYDLAEGGEGYVFGSEEITSCTEIKYDEIGKISPERQKDILLFDLWVYNEDRTLSELGGNPNLLWQSEQLKLYVIDHNLIFDHDHKSFWETHIFRQIIRDHPFDMIDKLNYENRMQKALTCWQSAWEVIPQDWKTLNEEIGLFNPDETLQRLSADARGNIWRKLP